MSRRELAQYISALSVAAEQARLIACALNPAAFEAAYDLDCALCAELHYFKADRRQGDAK